MLKICQFFLFDKLKYEQISQGPLLKIFLYKNTFCNIAKISGMFKTIFGYPLKVERTIFVVVFLTCLINCPTIVIIYLHRNAESESVRVRAGPGLYDRGGLST